MIPDCKGKLKRAYWCLVVTMKRLLLQNSLVVDEMIEVVKSIT
jgi:hypothetical protein